MRGSHRARVARWAVGVAFALMVLSCGGDDTVEVPGRDGAVKSAAHVRAERRAYDGAPPTIPHDDFGTTCGACHDANGQAVEGVGYAPASPHEGTLRAGATVRCRQCHVVVTTDRVFVASDYVGAEQNLRPGGRATLGAPPTIPHRVLMRENCLACHDGPGVREEVRTTHPERWRCRQCHVAVTSRDRFETVFGAGLSQPD